MGRAYRLAPIPSFSRLIESGGLVIGSGEGTTLQVTHQVLDCSIVRQDQPAPMLLWLRRPWGHRTTTLQAGMPSSGLAWTACHGST
jgi:hypothetical protein